MHVEYGEMVEDSADRAQDDDLTVLRWWMEEQMTLEDIRNYCMDWMDPEEYTWTELEHQVGAMLNAQGHELSECENDAQRMGWRESELLSAQYDRENDGEYDAEALADAEQAVRDNADRALRAYQYA